MSVEYRTLPQYPGYRFGRDGSVWTCKIGGRHKNGLPGLCTKWRRMKCGSVKSGHLFIHPFAGRRCIKKYVHHLVMLAFGKRRPSRKECRHLDGNPKNNRLSNLSWGTRRENCADAKKHGTDNTGVRNGKAILTEPDVRKIRRWHSKGYRVCFLAKLFGTSSSNISLIVHRVNWRHI